MSKKDDLRINNGGVVNKITFEERKEIEKFAKLKISGHEIGKVLGRGGSSINRELRRCGGRDNYTAEKAHANMKKEIAKRGNSATIPFSKEELNRVKEMVHNKVSLTQIRRTMKFSFYRFQRVLDELGLPAINLMTLAEELENRLYVVEEQIKMLTEMMETK